MQTPLQDIQQIGAGLVEERRRVTGATTFSQLAPGDQFRMVCLSPSSRLRERQRTLFVDGVGVAVYTACGNGWFISKDSLRRFRTGAHVLVVKVAERFVIRSTQDPTDFWSNEEGWSALEEATTFTEDESKRLRLPLDGEWMAL